MAFKHPLIPELQWQAAATCGKLVAQGVLEWREPIDGLMEAAIRAGYRGSKPGLRTHLSWQVRDIAGHWRLARSRTAYQINQALWPPLHH